MPGLDRLVKGLLIVIIVISLVLAGCTVVSVPPQNTGGTVRIVEGGLVETLAFFDGPTFNIQITREDISPSEFFFSHVLTIGRFSPLWGSGFTKRSNIYYESRILPSGHDTFMAGSEEYRVIWQEICVGDRIASESVFLVTIERTAVDSY